MKFLADINISPRVVEGLRAAGYVVQHVPELLDCTASDRQIVEEARRRDAVVISHDRDFGAILATTKATKPSLLYLRVTYVDSQMLIGTILTVIASSHEELSNGAIVTVDDAQIRIRPLPVR